MSVFPRMLNLRFLLTFIGSINFAFNSVSQNFNYQWARDFEGSAYGIGKAVIADALGNVYSVGSFSTFVDFDPGPGTTTLTANNGNNNTFISKLDANGNFVWARSLYGNENSAFSIDIDNNGNIIVAGQFQGTVDFDPSPATFIVNANSAAAPDIYILKLDATGNFVWAKNMGGGTVSTPVKVATDNVGNLYASGYFAGTVDFDPGPGVYNLSSNTQFYNDVFIFKLDGSGNYIWAKSLGGKQYEYDFGMAMDVNGNIFLGGTFQDTVDFDPGPTTATLVAYGNGNGYVMKLDNSGNYVWAKSFDSTVVYGLECDGQGNVLATGCYAGNIDFDPGPAVTTLTSSLYYSNIFVLKLSSSGLFQWAKGVGGNNDDWGYSITSDQACNVYVTGDFQNFGDFDPGPATTTLTSAGAWDIFVLSLNASGNYINSFSIGSGAYDRGRCIYVDQFNNVYLTGNFTGFVDFNPSVASSTLGAAGVDIYVAKYNAVYTELNGENVFCGLNIGPNPFSSELIVYNSKLEEPTRYYIFDNLGQLNKMGTLFAGKNKIETGELSEGMYALRIIYNNNQINYKILKQN